MIKSRHPGKGWYWKNGLYVPAAAAPSWSPGDEASTIWYDADQESAGALATFTDRSGNGLHLTQSTGSAQPTIVANAINGKKSLQFDGGDLLVRTNATNVISQSAAFTLYFIVKMTAPGGLAFYEPLVLSSDGAIGNVRGLCLGFVHDPGNAWPGYQYMYWGETDNGWGSWRVATPMMDGNPHLVQIGFGGSSPTSSSSWSCKIDNVTKTVVSANSLNSNNNNIHFGGISSASFIGDFPELLLRTTASADAPSYFMTKWGIS